MTAKAHNDDNSIEQAEEFIRQQMDRNDISLGEIIDLDCRGFDRLRESMRLQHDTDKFLLSTIRITRNKVSRIDETTKETNDAVKQLLGELQKQGGSNTTNSKGKTLAKWKVPFFGEAELQGFRANDVILIILGIGLVVVAAKAWSTKEAVADRDRLTTEIRHERDSKE